VRPWIKLYTEILTDPKMHALTDRQFRTCVNLFALAGFLDQDGLLPPLADLAFHLRTNAADLEGDLVALLAVHVLDADDGGYIVAHWAERQPTRAPSAMPERVRERVRQYRARKAAEGNAVTDALRAHCNDVTDSLQAPPLSQDVEQIRVEERTLVTPSLPTRYNSLHAVTSGTAGAGRALATKLQVLNGKLPAAQRTPLAEEVLRICGKAAVADTATDDGDRARFEAHEKAVTLHEMGYQSPAALMEVESFWYDVWPGKKDGERPSFRQLVDTASKLKAGNGRPKEQPTEVYR